jgi:hypothetical protein
VEQHRVDALHPGRMLAAQVMVGLQHRPAFQDVPGRDPVLRQPALGQQYPQVPAVGLVGLGVPLAAAGERGISRLGQMRSDAGRGQLLRDIPPPGAPLHCERNVPGAVEPRQPGAQVLPVGRADLAALHLPGAGVEVVEGDLLSVDIRPPTMGIGTSSRSGGAQARAPCQLPTRLIVTLLSWGGLPHLAAGLSPARPDACHLMAPAPADRHSVCAAPNRAIWSPPAACELIEQPVDPRLHR